MKILENIGRAIKTRAAEALKQYSSLLSNIKLKTDKNVSAVKSVTLHFPLQLFRKFFLRNRKS